MRHSPSNAVKISGLPMEWSDLNDLQSLDRVAQFRRKVLDFFLAIGNSAQILPRVGRFSRPALPALRYQQIDLTNIGDR
jgi:hypothetical protein